MTSDRGRIPAGPTERLDPAADLLAWMSNQFALFGDIFSATIYGTRVYAIRDPAYAEHVLRKNWQNYVKGQAIKRVALLLGGGLMVSEREVWKHQRRMVQPAFHRSAVANLTGVITGANAALLAKWQAAAAAGRSVDVTADVSATILEITLRAIFGDDYVHVGTHFRVVSEESERNLEFARVFQPLGKVILDLAARRRKAHSSRGDILGMLMDARDRDTGQPMTDRQLVNEIKTLIVAGHETTASTLNWIWYLLAEHPDVERKLDMELAADDDGDVVPDMSALPKYTYTRQIIDEALRLYPAGWLLTRRALEDDHLGPYFVPAGTEVYVPVYHIQRHPRLWKHPDRFDPDRFSSSESQERHPLAFLPFSAGPRNCVGETFARLEMQLHVITIARRLSWRRTDTILPEFDIGVNLRSKRHFNMEPVAKIVTARRVSDFGDLVLEGSTRVSPRDMP